MPEINTMLVLIFLIIVTLGGFFAGRKSSGKDGVEMEDLFEPFTDIETTHIPPEEITDPEIFESVLLFFEQAYTSGQILHMLAVSEEKLSYAELTDDLNQYFNRNRKSILPEHAVKSVVMILMGANLVRMKNGDLVASAVGKRLWEMIRERES